MGHRNRPKWVKERCQKQEQVLTGENADADISIARETGVVKRVHTIRRTVPERGRDERRGHKELELFAEK